MKNEIRSLLAEVNTIDQKYDFMYRKTGAYFNVFDITNIKTNEVKICRLFKELLDPKGCHCQGAVYLKLFIKYVLNMDEEFLEVDYQTALVDREYVIENNRRIDLVICIKQKVIPIEVKINAKDEENQCKDYLKIAKGANLYYLTLRGDQPSSLSIGSGLQDEITTISFEREIITWLDQCLKFTENKRLIPISEVLRQFIEIIRRLTNRMEEGKEQEIISIVSESSKNMKSAMMIEQSLQQAKVAMILKVLETLDQKITCKPEYVKLGKRLEDIIYDDKAIIVNYYVNKKATYPGLSYCYKKNIKMDMDLWFRIEIDQSLFCGFCIPKENKDLGSQLSVDEAKDILKYPNNLKYETNNWWIHRDHLPYEDASPNFKTYNDAWYDLFDEVKFNKFIEKCMETVKRVLSMG